MQDSMQDDVQDRTDQLKAITRLPVSCHTGGHGAGAVLYFVFGRESNPIKTVWTFHKAKIFAEGFAAGRSATIAISYPPGEINES